MNRSTTLIGLLCVACGVAPEAANSLEQQRHAIRGGVASSLRAVVAVQTALETCTGTLIAPEVVLTAGHCIDSADQPSSILVLVGEDSASPEQSIQVTEIALHPNFARVNGGAIYDALLLRLARAPDNVIPIPVAQNALTTDFIGRQVKHVGYGRTSAQGPSGLRRQALYNIRGLSNLFIESASAEQQVLYGDSGGPALVMNGSASGFGLASNTGPLQGEQVVGIVSFGDAAGIVEAFDQRTDALGGWLNSLLSAWGQPASCLLDGQCQNSCKAEDPDCVTTADGLCAANESIRAFDPDCSSECTANGRCVARCGADPDCKPTGESCTQDSNCASLRCLVRPSGNVCTQACAQSTCPSGWTCSELKVYADAIATSSKLCLPPATATTKLANGAVCAANADCSSALCVQKTSTKTCETPCGANDRCDAKLVCVSGLDKQRYCQVDGTGTVGLPGGSTTSLPYTETDSGCQSGLGHLVGLLGVASCLRRKRARA